METRKHFHEPTISESLGNGWYTMKKYFLYLLLAMFVSGIFNGPMRYTFGDGDDLPKWELNGLKIDFEPQLIGLAILAGLVAMAIFFLIRPVFKYGASMMFLQGARDEQPEFKWLIEGFKKNYLNIVLAHLLATALTAIAFVALIIPGIIVACRLAFVPYLMMDKSLEPVKAIEESWRITKGHGWTIFGLALSAIPIFIIGFICLIIGIFPAAVWLSASFASLYQSILTANGGLTDPYNNPEIIN